METVDSTRGVVGNTAYPDLLRKAVMNQAFRFFNLTFVVAIESFEWCTGTIGGPKTDLLRVSSEISSPGA